LKKLARCLCWGKFFNAGQTCIAPDYILLCKPDLRDKFVKELKKTITSFYGANDAEINDPDKYPRIVNQSHVQRLKKLLEECQDKVVIGGTIDSAQRYIAPTVLIDVDPNSLIMKDEIFGPLLPILCVSDLQEAIEFVNDRPKPLALYVFSNVKSEVQKVLDSTSSGGVCVNDVLVHITHDGLPFGGVGSSGMGSYHGRKSFETFSHQKSVLIRKQSLEKVFAVRYPPLNMSKMNRLICLLHRRSNEGLMYRFFLRLARASKILRPLLLVSLIFVLGYLAGVLKK